MENEELIKAVENGFSTHNNIHTLSITKDKVVLEVELSDISYNPFKTVHGGLLFGMADNAMGYLLAANNQVSVTVNASINYLKTATGTKLTAIATPIKIGNKIAFVECRIYNDKQEVIASSQGTFYKIQP